MKKIIISVIIVLLCVLIYLLIFRGISIGKFRIQNIKGIKSISQTFEEKISDITIQTSQSYPMKRSEIEKNIKELNSSKETYENKAKYAQDNSSVGVTQIEKYKSEYLWTIIGNYARDRKINLTLDIVAKTEDNTKDSDVYNLNFTLVGKYIGVTDFIYDIENDDSFSFVVSNLKMLPFIEERDIRTDAIKEIDPTTININQIDLLNKTRTDQKITTLTDNVKVTFTVREVGIMFN